MTHEMEPALFDQDDPRERGRAHGELWREPIRELAEIRVQLALHRGSFADLDELLAIARRHLPILAMRAPDLHEELLGIAEGADIDPARIVVLNHYTDLRDIDPRAVLGPEAEGCTAIYLYGPNGAVLGQTWDMHASAEPYVRTIRIAPRGSDTEALCFTLTGCLGMTGIGQHGVAVTINNLSSTDARVGMVWPALVRQMITQADAASAWALLRDAPLSSGHHYMIADGRDFYGVETSGELKVLTQSGAKVAHLHTNHCFDPVLRSRERVPATSTTFARLDLASTLYVQRRPTTMEELWDLIGSHEGFPRSICSHADDGSGDPSASKTCGRIVYALAEGRARVARGCSREAVPLELVLGRFRSRAAPEADG
jgi:isopenicillin-N N-acyltransferase-like protein